jgi:hypothetical protein
MTNVQTQTQPDQDQREALYNDPAVGTATQIAMPREAVTRLRGLVIDLDSNILKPNPWFPPAADAATFHCGITPVLERHPVLRYAEVRNTGRYLHLIVWFQTAVELRTAAEQRTWTGIHAVLKASVPSDPAAHPLITLTRPIGAVNSKTGAMVSRLKVALPVDSAALQAWANDVARKPFEALGMILFGQKRITPCPYCNTTDSYLDLGDRVGYCYGPCRTVPLSRFHKPFMLTSALKARASNATAVKGGSTPKRRTRKNKN